MTGGRPTYSYAEVAARIGAVLGKQPSVSVLRAAAAEATRTLGTNSRVRLTAGMPAPLPRTRRTDPACFDAAQVERWLANHPRAQSRSRYQELVAAMKERHELESAIARARAAGLSWRRIAAALTEATGAPRTHQGVHKTYRHVQLH